MLRGVRKHGAASCKVGFTMSVPSHIRGGMREISAIEVPAKERGKGDASALLDRICAEADLTGKVLMLTPQPYGNVGLNQDELQDWYARFGFQVIQAKPLMMARQAQKIPHG